MILYPCLILKIHYFSSLFHSLLSLTLLHYSLSSPLLLPLILLLFLHLPPYSHPLTPSTHRYQHPSIIPPNSILPTHILFYSSPITLTSIIRLLSFSSTFLAIYLIFVIFDQLVFPCPPERCPLQKYTTFHHFFTPYLSLTLHHHSLSSFLLLSLILHLFLHLPPFLILLLLLLIVICSLQLFPHIHSCQGLPYLLTIPNPGLNKVVIAIWQLRFVPTPVPNSITTFLFFGYTKRFFVNHAQQ